ncbi:MAG: VanZ family protein [Calditrichaeota bacterium]|nr:VanZ family protein [Calditrichota bacterium]
MMLLITIQSGLSSELLSVKIPKGVDKIIHFAIFGLLGWLMTRGFLMSEKIFLKKHYLWLVPLIGALFAVLDEFHQALVPGRYPDFFDWTADFLGIVVFMLLYKKRNPVPN